MNPPKPYASVPEPSRLSNAAGSLWPRDAFSFAAGDHTYVLRIVKEIQEQPDESYGPEERTGLG